ncbi:MAG: hypothetical protein WBD79_16490 [Anaerolineae bacterium]
MIEPFILNWTGPYRWPKGGRQSRIDALEYGGVYLLSVEYNGGYLVYAAGHTSHFWKRFRQHDRLYRNGTYTIFDHNAFTAGERVKIWPGFWMRKVRPPELVEEYSRRATEIEAARERWLGGYRVFVARTDVDRRLRQRIEASLMSAFMTAEPPVCNMPDTGMSLAPRWPWEAPFSVVNVVTRQIWGLPSSFEA